MSETLISGGQAPPRKPDDSDIRINADGIRKGKGDAGFKRNL